MTLEPHVSGQGLHLRACPVSDRQAVQHVSARAHHEGRRGESAVSALEEEKWNGRHFGLQVLDAPEHDVMIAGLVDALELAVDPGDHSVDDGSARGRRRPTDTGELVTATDGELTADRFLLRRQDVDAEGACLTKTFEGWGGGGGGGRAEGGGAGRKGREGGSRGTAWKPPTAIPEGRPSGITAVMTTTPVGRYPRTSRKRLSSKAVSTSMSAPTVVC